MQVHLGNYFAANHTLFAEKAGSLHGQFSMHFNLKVCEAHTLSVSVCFLCKRNLMQIASFMQVAFQSAE